MEPIWYDIRQKDEESLLMEKVQFKRKTYDRMLDWNFAGTDPAKALWNGTLSIKWRNDMAAARECKKG